MDKKVGIKVFVSQELRDKIEKECKEEEINMSVLIRQVLIKHFKDKEN